MLEAGITVQPLYVWEVLKKKLQAQGVKEIKASNGQIYNLNEWAGHFTSQTFEVENKLEDVARQIEKEKGSKQKLGEIQKGTPITSGGGGQETRLK